MRDKQLLPCPITQVSLSPSLKADGWETVNYIFLHYTPIHGHGQQQQKSLRCCCCCCCFKQYDDTSPSVSMTKACTHVTRSGLFYLPVYGSWLLPVLHILCLMTDEIIIITIRFSHVLAKKVLFSLPVGKPPREILKHPLTDERDSSTHKV